MQQIQSGVNPSSVIVTGNGRALQEPFVNGLTWAVVLEFADRNDCVIFRDGDTLHVLVLSQVPPIAHWGNA